MLHSAKSAVKENMIQTTLNMVCMEHDVFMQPIIVPKK